MPKPKITVEQSAATTTQVVCGFTLTVTVTVRDDGSEWWQVRGHTGDRGASALSEIEGWIAENLASSSSGGGNRDWWYHGSDGDIDGLLKFAGAVCRGGAVPKSPSGLILEIRGDGAKSHKAKIPLTWYDNADQFIIGEGAEPAWLAAYIDGFYELLQMFMYEDGMCEGEYEGENEKVLTWKLVATTAEAKEHLAEICR